MNMREEIGETLRKQLELLSERSKSPRTQDADLPALTHAMIEVAAALRTNFL